MEVERKWGRGVFWTGSVCNNLIVQESDYGRIGRAEFGKGNFGQHFKDLRAGNPKRTVLKLC